MHSGPGPSDGVLPHATRGDEPLADPADFSSTTELQRLRAITAGAGMDAAMGYPSARS